MVYQPCRHRTVAGLRRAAHREAWPLIFYRPTCLRLLLPPLPALPGKSHYCCNYFQEDVLTNISYLLSLINTTTFRGVVLLHDAPCASLFFSFFCEVVMLFSRVCPFRSRLFYRVCVHALIGRN